MQIKELFQSIKKTLTRSRLGQIIFALEEVGGLEITSEAIRLAFFEYRGDTTIWRYYGVKTLPPGIIVNNQVKKPEELGSQIKQLFHECVKDKKLKEVIICMPEINGYLDRFTLPIGVPENMITSVILNNASELFPFPINELYISWQNIRVEELERKLLIAYAKRDIIDPYKKAVEIAGLKPVALQTAALGFDFFIEFPKDIAIVYFLEKDFCTVSVHLDGKIFYKRTTGYEENITKGTTVSAETIAGFIEKNIVKIQNFVGSELKQEYPYQVLILSSLPISQEITETLKQKKIPVATVAMKLMEIPEKITDVPSWTPLIGAASRGLFLRKNDTFASLFPDSPQALYLQRQRSIFFSRTIKILLTTLLFYIISFAVLGIYLSSLEKATEKQIAAQQKITIPETLLQLEEEMNNFNTAVDKVALVKQNLISLLPSLQVINNLRFSGIAISSFKMRIEGKAVLINLIGSATTREALLKFREYLTNDLHFTDIKLPPQALELRENINFTISCSYAS